MRLVFKILAGLACCFVRSNIIISDSLLCHVQFVNQVMKQVNLALSLCVNSKTTI